MKEAEINQLQIEALKERGDLDLKSSSFWINLYKNRWKFSAKPILTNPLEV